MATKSIRIVVNGDPHVCGGAPIVEDLLDQLRDFGRVLRASEGGRHGRAKLRWDIAFREGRPPLVCDLTPISTAKNDDVDHLASSVARAVSSTVNQIIATGAKPKQMTDATFNRVNKIVNRAANGLFTFEVDLSKFDEAKNIRIDRAIAAAYIERKENLRGSFSAPRWEIGSMEGYTVGVTTNQRGKTVLKIRSRLQGNIINCVESGNGLDQIRSMEMHEIIDGRRIRVNGLLHYKNIDEVDRIKVDDMYVCPLDSELPDLETLPATNITNGLGAVEYLRRLHDGTLDND